MWFYVSINGKPIQITEKEKQKILEILNSYVANLSQNSDVVVKLDDERSPEEIAAGMPRGLSPGDRFYFRQDHGLTSSSEDRFGF